SVNGMQLLSGWPVFLTQHCFIGRVLDRLATGRRLSTCYLSTTCGVHRSPHSHQRHIASVGKRCYSASRHSATRLIPSSGCALFSTIQRPSSFPTGMAAFRQSVFTAAIDQGTTSSRFLIFDSKGTPVANHQVEFEQIYPHSGYRGLLRQLFLKRGFLTYGRWIEHDPEEI